MRLSVNGVQTATALTIFQPDTWETVNAGLATYNAQKCTLVNSRAAA